MCCSFSSCLSILCCFFYCWVLISLHCGQTVNVVISVFLYLLKHILCLKVWSILDNVPRVTKKNVYCAIAGWILCSCLSGPGDIRYHSISESLCWFFLSRRPSFGDRKVLKSPTMTVLWSFCDLKSTSVCLMNLFALALGKYILVIVISS
jgi:hypothetical protein